MRARALSRAVHRSFTLCKRWPTRRRVAAAKATEAMLKRLVTASLRHRWVVLTLAALLVILGACEPAESPALTVSELQVYAPLPNEKKQLQSGNDPYAPKARDSEQMSAFRARMGTPEAKEVYKQRPSIAEFPNADCRNRGLHQFRVRGCVKAKAQTLWHVLAFNFLRMKHLNFLETIMSV